MLKYALLDSPKILKQQLFLIPKKHIFGDYTVIKNYGFLLPKQSVSKNKGMVRMFRPKFWVFDYHQELHFLNPKFRVF
jgi:hypothetical protein